MLHSITFSSVLRPEIQTIDQVRNTIGQILLNLGKNIDLLTKEREGESPVRKARMAELWGRIIGHNLAGLIKTENLPRLDHHIYNVNDTEVELRIDRRSKPAQISVFFSSNGYQFEGLAVWGENSAGLLISQAEITPSSGIYLHTLNGLLKEAGISFNIKFYDIAFPKKHKDQIWEGRYTLRQ